MGVGDERERDAGDGASTAMGRAGLPIKKRPDPDHVALRRAVQAALVIPTAFAFSLRVFGDVQFATFAVFGCFALLVMTDFGGHRPDRALAYVASTLVGAVLVTLGTLVSPIAGAAAPVMLVAGFALSFSGVFGGYVAAARQA